MIETRGPHFRDLDRGEVDEILTRNNVGRIAFARENLIDILPVHYVYSGDWIYGRTTPGGRVDTLGEPWWPVAFEVDEVDGLFHREQEAPMGSLTAVFSS